VSTKVSSPEMPHILLVFLDGVGLGSDDPEVNPFAHPFPVLERLAGVQPWIRSAPAHRTQNLVFNHIDANLSVDGLPQSGTGQASLFTGINCARLAGKHFGPFPHSKTRKAISEHNLFRQIKGQDRTEPCAFANAYPKEFFDRVEAQKRFTVTTLCCHESGVPIRRMDALTAGRAVTADLTGRGWRDQLGYAIPIISEYEAGHRLARLSADYQLTLFEYYLTDKAGHKQDLNAALMILQTLDDFFRGILETLGPDTLLVVTSDHGNMEDLSTRSHTRNPIPFIANGHDAMHFAGVNNLLDVTPAIIAYLRQPI